MMGAHKIRYNYIRIEDKVGVWVWFAKWVGLSQKLSPLPPLDETLHTCIRTIAMMSLLRLWTFSLRCFAHLLVISSAASF